MPLGAFCVCVFLSIYKDFELANHTHCRVPNILPSISSCISNFYPQNTLWRLSIGIDSFPRYLIAIIYFNKYYSLRQSLAQNKSVYNFLIKLAFIFHIIELTSLLVLTYVSSVEIFSVHMMSFVVFLFTSSVYMLLTILTYYLTSNGQLSQRDEYSKKLKISIFLFYQSSLLASLYFYIRHNLKCEPYIYSYFSLCEYLTVLANIAYHSMIIYDLKLNNSIFKISLIELKSS